MKSFSNLPYYSTSLITHLIVILVIIAISSHRAQLTPVFQTSVVFEPAKSTKAVAEKIEKPISKKDEEIPQVYKTKQKKPETDKVPTGVDATEVFNKSASLKKSELTGFLRANKRTEKLKTSQTKGTGNKNKESVEKDSSTPLFSDHKYSSTANTNADSEVDQHERSGPLTVWKRKNEIVSFRNILRSLVKANWTVPPVALKEFEIRITAIIDPNGNLLDLILVKSSGLIMLNSAAEKAIRVSTPFPKVPKSILNDNQEFHATFRFTPNEVSN
ncbi:TonB C-terminal domain-containing protein [bacterium]|nr:TonB C-terminal domain-containing protein [bacterium]